MNTEEKMSHDYEFIETRLGYSFKDKTLLQLAFIHKSYINEHPEIVAHNERLEFLGDAILGAIVSEYLYLHYPHLPEGDLSLMRSRIVEARSCVGYMEKLDLEKFILLGKGESRTGGRGRFSILADLFEALIGAIYLDADLNTVRHFIMHHFRDDIDRTLETPPSNWKALLQDVCQKKFQQTPVYILQRTTGPEHSKQFEIAVEIQGRLYKPGIGPTKKEAQQLAAKEALIILEEEDPTRWLQK